MAVSTRSRTRSCGTSTQDARTQKRCRKQKRPASQSQRSPSLSRPLSTLSDLPNELLHKILAELPRSVETTIALATTCRRLNEFAMAYHFGSDSYMSFGRHSQPFASFRMLRLSFLHKPRLSFIYCIFSDNFSKEMTEIQRSLAVLKAMGTDFHVSFNGMDWSEIPAEKHVAFFEDLSKLKCHTIDTSDAGPKLTNPSMANGIIKFAPPALTQLSKVTLSQLPECYIAWMLRSINQSSITTLCLHSLSDDNLLELNKLPLHHLQDVTLSSCTSSFAAVAAFLKTHQHITFLDTGTWSPISTITGSKGRRRSNRVLKTSLEPATRMSKLSIIIGTATAIRALLSTPEAFPSLERVNVMEGDVAGMQEALLLISHIPTVYHLRLYLQDLNEWLQFKFPHRRGVERAESLLKTITDLLMRGISPANIPAVAGLLPNLKRFHTFSFLDIVEKDILGFVKRMKAACPGLETVRVDWSDFFTDPKWLQQKQKELDEQER
ncbi:uncharacterized protein ARMOST_13694 [Armillaria ostoyae]|uniref:F-box domain-containing protein n=1 Tax=Armillaria ostoyae TaxID=47428 RepID=A0A284RNH2_ARMOS|nr:uncharacterized protein ARMOST_13694 [Armillaria ostoyae]